MISACEQCGRNQVPTLHPPTKLQQQLSHYPTESHHTGFVLDPTAELRCSDFPTPDHNLALLVGPEGGLTTDEIERAEQHGFRRVHLGPRILRTETATVVAITTLQTLWGDL